MFKIVFKCTFLVLLNLFLMIHAFAEETPSPSTNSQSSQSQSNWLSVANPNAISFELLGRAGLYSFNYDRLLIDYVALGVGFSAITIRSTSGANSNNATALLFPVYGNFYLPLKSKTHRFYGTVGVTFAHSSSSADTDTGDVANESGTGTGYIAGVGYEYRSQDVDGGFIFRASVNVLKAGDSIFAPWPGVSAGYAF